MRYLLDANVLSEPLKPRPDERLLERLQRFEHQSCTASVVLFELLRGAHRMPAGKKRDHVLTYLQQTLSPQLLVLPYDHKAAAWHASEHARLESRGIRPQYADAQIAAVARANDLIVVTANTRDFEDFDGLQVEDWRS